MTDPTELEERKRQFRREAEQLREERTRSAKLAAVPAIGETFDVDAMVAKLRAMAPVVEDTPEPTVDAFAQRCDRRRHRLRVALGLREDETSALAAMEPLVTALDGPPVVPGHAGSAKAAEAVVRFVSGRARTLLMVGTPGHGKTWAATWALASRDGSLLVTARDIRVGDAFGWSERLAKALVAPLLVFDELGQEGKEGGSSWALDEAAGLIETRQTKGRPTIITTNLPVSLSMVRPENHAEWKGRTIDERYGDRLKSRLTDAETGVIVRIEGHKKIRDMTADERSGK